MADSKKSTITRLIFKHVFLVVIVFEIIIGYLLQPDLFLTPGNVQVILFVCVVSGLLAMAQGLALIGREIDLSVGAILVVAPMLAVQMTNIILRALTGEGILIGLTGLMTGGWAMVLILTIAFAVLIGMLNGFLVAKAGLPSFIVTIGMSFFLVGVGYLASSGTPIFFQNLEETKFIGNASIAGFVPVSFVLVVAIGLLMIFLMGNTRYGLRIYATGGNEVSARLAGINTKAWKVIVFASVGALVGIAGVLNMSRLQGVDVAQNANFTLISIVICIIGGVAVSGGTGTIAGIMQATLLVAILFNILGSAGFDHYDQLVVSGLAVVVLSSVYKRADSRRLKRLKIIEV